MGDSVKLFLVIVLLLVTVFGLSFANFMALNYSDNVGMKCSVPPESEVVCGYVHDDNPNHAGLYLRGTGCAPYGGDDE